MYSSTYLLQIDINLLKQVSFPFLLAFIASIALIPLIIKLVHKFHLFDKPDIRKEHSNPIPTLGGIAIVAGTMLALTLWETSFSTTGLYVMAAILLLFIMGIIDDLRDLKANVKLLIELAIAAMIAYGGLRITSLHGLFGINELPIILQYVFTIIAIAGVTNAFNLIDGIDGLAGGLSLISLVTAGALLMISGDHFFALIAFAMAGGVAGFLLFNYYPAKIFMGDTGSLVIGFVLAVLAIRFMQVNINPIGEISNIPVIALSLVLIPVFDTLRVFTFRILNGKSPFNPDKRHLHHLLTNAGFNHGLVSRLICFFHALILFQVILLAHLDQELVLITSIMLITLVTLAFKTIGERRMPAVQKTFASRIENQKLKIKDLILTSNKAVKN